MRQSGATAVITLCCSPDWMKGAPAGTTDWSNLEAAPLPSHYDDFAALAAMVARRYPDVKHFMVWNELKGFYDAERGEWDIESYTDLYNKVYAALKAVNPRIQVGGPYVPMDSGVDPKKMSDPSGLAGSWGTVDQRALDAITYWLTHARGADFVAVDGGTGNKDRPDVAPSTGQTEKFAVINRWLRTVTDLPIWWAEMHLGGLEHYPPQTSVDMLVAALSIQASSGASVVLIWQPEGTSAMCQLCMWSSTKPAGGGAGTDAYLAVAPALAHQPNSASDFGSP